MVVVKAKVHALNFLLEGFQLLITQFVQVYLLPVLLGHQALHLGENDAHHDVFSKKLHVLPLHFLDFLESVMG